MTARTLRILTVVAAVAGTLLLLGHIWWWAILGMSKDIGTALGVTTGSLLSASIVVGVIAHDKGVDERESES